MEITTIEVATVEEANSKADALSIKELAELQLALVGGGIGDPIAA